MSTAQLLLHSPIVIDAVQLRGRAITITGPSSSSASQLHLLSVPSKFHPGDEYHTLSGSGYDSAAGGGAAAKFESSPPSSLSSSLISGRQRSRVSGLRKYLEIVLVGDVTAKPVEREESLLMKMDFSSSTTGGSSSFPLSPDSTAGGAISLHRTTNTNGNRFMLPRLAVPKGEGGLSDTLGSEIGDARSPPIREGFRSRTCSASRSTSRSRSIVLRVAFMVILLQRLLCSAASPSQSLESAIGNSTMVLAGVLLREGLQYQQLSLVCGYIHSTFDLEYNFTFPERKRVDWVNLREIGLPWSSIQLLTGIDLENERFYAELEHACSLRVCPVKYVPETSRSKGSTLWIWYLLSLTFPIIVATISSWRRGCTSFRLRHLPAASATTVISVTVAAFVSLSRPVLCLAIAGVLLVFWAVEPCFRHCIQSRLNIRIVQYGYYAVSIGVMAFTVLVHIAMWKMPWFSAEMVVVAMVYLVSLVASYVRNRREANRVNASVEVLLWPFSPKLPGHLALRVKSDLDSDPLYLSFYPARLGNALGSFYTAEEDRQKYERQAPPTVITVSLTTVEFLSLRAWVLQRLASSLAEFDQHFRMLGNNCSSMVLRALSEGGQMTNWWEIWLWASVNTPGWVAGLAATPYAAIASAGMGLCALPLLARFVVIVALRIFDNWDRLVWC
jgi:hypothetical protein